MRALLLLLAAGLPAEEGPREPAAPVPLYWADVQLRRYVAPEYPVAAQSALVEGRCLVRVTADEAGEVTAAKAEEGACPPELAPAAESAARQWALEPTLIAGEPRAVTYVAPLTFALPRYEWWREGLRPESMAWPPEMRLAEGERSLLPKRRVEPEMPESVLASPRAGEATCTARLYVDAVGAVSGVVVVGCHPDLAAEVLRVLPKWRFAPAVAGTPTRETVQRIVFRVH